MIYGIALGSNLGDRLKFLQQGLEELFSYQSPNQVSIHALGIAPLFESDPVDCPEGSQPFFNSVIEIETELSPRDLLSVLQSIQEHAGRPKVHGHNSPRTLDLDILYAEGLVHHDEALELPHPRMHLRRFVLEPLFHLAQDREITFPNGKTQKVAELWKNLNSEEQPLRLIQTQWFSL